MSFDYFLEQTAQLKNRPVAHSIVQIPLYKRALMTLNHKEMSETGPPALILAPTQTVKRKQKEQLIALQMNQRFALAKVFNWAVNRAKEVIAKIWRETPCRSCGQPCTVQWDISFT